MTKIVKNDLVNSNINEMISSLDLDITDTDKVIEILSSFVEETTTELISPSYDAARKKIESYITILNKRKEIAQNLKSAISYAVNNMNSYMEDSDFLDDSNLQDITSKLNQVSFNLEKAYASLKDETSENYKDCINAVVSYQSLYDELIKLKDKLVNLAPTDESAYSKVAAELSNISLYKSSVDSVTVTSI